MLSELYHKTKCQVIYLLQTFCSFKYFRKKKFCPYLIFYFLKQMCPCIAYAMGIMLDPSLGVLHSRKCIHGGKTLGWLLLGTTRTV